MVRDERKQNHMMCSVHDVRIFFLENYLDSVLGNFNQLLWGNISCKNISPIFMYFLGTPVRVAKN